MKKIIALSILGTLILAGCGSQDTASNETKDIVKATEEKKKEEKVEKVEENDTAEKENASTEEQTIDSTEPGESTSEEQKNTVAIEKSTVSNEKSYSTTKTPATTPSTSKTSNQTNTTTKPSQPTSSTPAPSAPAPSTPAPSAPAPSAPAPSAPAPSQPAPSEPSPTPTQPTLSATAQKVQNALPSGYVAEDSSGAVSIKRSGTEVARVSHSSLLITSLSNGDIQAGVQGASALGGNSANIHQGISLAMQNAGPQVVGNTTVMKDGNRIIVSWTL